MMLIGVASVYSSFLQAKSQPTYATYHEPVTQMWNQLQPMLHKPKHSVAAKTFFTHTCNAGDFSKMFTPRGTTQMQLNSIRKGDINPSWLELLGLPAVSGASSRLTWNYTSLVTLQPYRYEYGVWFDWFAKLSRLWSLRASWSIMGMTAGVKIVEEGGGNGSSPNPAKPIITDFYAAMNQEKWLYGKMSEKQTAFGVGALLFDFEYQIPSGAATAHAVKQHIRKDGVPIPYLQAHHERQTIGLRLQLPTGKGSTAKYFYEPRVGTNHAGIGIWYQYENHEQLFNWGMQAGAHVYMPAHEMRSLDLKPNGPWSRYLLLAHSSDIDQDVPAINIVTKRVKVFPGVLGYINLVSQYHHQSHHLQLGYRFFAKTKESVSLSEGIDPGYSVYNISRIVPRLGGLPGRDAMREATIDQGSSGMFNPAQETDFIQLTDADLDTSTAGSPAWVSSLGTCVYTYTTKYGACMCGALFELAHTAGAQSSWGVHIGYRVDF